jgi:hypothetical protein
MQRMGVQWTTAQRAMESWSSQNRIFENKQSTSRQYALRERARALGWADERIVVIDQDLGHSGALTTDRLGFQRLEASVGLGHVGLVLGLEVSQLRCFEAS